MNRRDFIITLTMATLGQGIGIQRVFAGKQEGDTVASHNHTPDNRRYKIEKTVIEKDACPAPQNVGARVRNNIKNKPGQSACLAPLKDLPPHLQADLYRQKMKDFDSPHPDDQYLPANQRQLLKNCVQRLRRVYRTVGHANFYLLGMDDALKLARGYVRIGAFTKAEVTFLESLFHRDAGSYGFFGKKQIAAFTHQIPKKQVNKIPKSANFLYRGPAVTLYQRLKKDIGPEAILTSGVRGVIKQTYLFLNKVHAHRGNLSLASRSIAPPGYSYHGIGDFDVGQRRLGHDNFSARFIQSKVFKKLHALDYICLRYTEENPFGVRFEPWHVMVSLSG